LPLRGRNPVETAIEVSLKNAIANVREEARQQHAVIEAGRFHTRHRMEVRARFVSVTTIHEGR